jgi:DNA mismatch endonuclease (patch repair protein)
MDHLNPELRSENMRRIRAQDTKPEMTVRQVLFRLGLRYRLHAKELPGIPDIVFRKDKIAIFVHGCFWHQHSTCGAAKTPKSNVEYWQTKLGRNVLRDRKNEAKLKELGFRVLTVWECEARNEETLRAYLITKLKGLGKIGSLSRSD